MAKRVTTLFIEDTAIRFLVARGRRADKWASVPLEPGLVKHGLVQDKEKLSEKIKDLFKWAELSNKSVVLGLSEPGSLYRIITLPKLPDAIIPEAVRREAERVIPLPQDEIYLAYQVIAVRQEDMLLFLAAFSRNAVDTLLSTLQMAGAKVASLDLVPLALCRAIDKSTAVVVSLRSSNFEIAVMADNIPQVIRSLSLPGETESLADKIPPIAEELERTITFYNSSHTEKPLDNSVPIYVDGELAGVPDSWPALVGTLGNPVATLPSLLQGETEFDTRPFTINFGLGLKENPQEVAGSIINFNALPRAFLPERPKASRVIIPIATVVAVLILVFVWMLAQNIRNNIKLLESELSSQQALITQTNKDLATLKDQIARVQAQVTPLQDQIADNQANATSISSTLNDLSSRRRFTDTIVSSIVLLIPSDMTINGITVSQSISISGSASYETIINYSQALSDTDLFGKVSIRSFFANDTGGYNFEMLIQPG